MIDLFKLNQFRQTKLEIDLYGQIGNHKEGIFAFRSPVESRVILRVVASADFGWDHVSVSPNRVKRCPTWEEMDWIKRKFFEPFEVAIQFHVSEGEHISFHQYCLHLWRSQSEPVPLPPYWMVGPKLERAR